MTQTPGQRDSRTRAKVRSTAATLAYAVAHPPVSGDEWEKTWESGPDACADRCAPLDGDTIPADDLFDGQFEGPPRHPNCTCKVSLKERHRKSAEIIARQILGG